MSDADRPDRERLSHHQRPLAWVLAVLTHLGLLAVCVSAAYTLQPPTYSLRRWAALALVALAALGYVAATRGRGAFWSSGKALTALLAGVALSLSYDPQLGNLPGVGEKLPQWLANLNPSLATVGVVWAGVFGLAYLGTVHTHHRHRHPLPYAGPVLAAGGLVILFGLGTYLGLSRAYEMDSASLGLLLSQTVQYGWLLLVALGLSGRIGVGGSMPVYLALTVLAALARNVLGGGEGP